MFDQEQGRGGFTNYNNMEQRSSYGQGGVKASNHKYDNDNLDSFQLAAAELSQLASAWRSREIDRNNLKQKVESIEAALLFEQDGTPKSMTYAFNHLIHLFGLLGYRSKMGQTLAHMEKIGLRLDSFTFFRLMEGYLQKEPSRVLPYFYRAKEELPSLTEYHYRMAIMACNKLKRFPKTLELWQEAKEQGIIDHIISSNAMLALNASGRSAEVHALLDELKAHGKYITDFTLSQVIVALEHEGNLDRVKEFCEQGFRDYVQFDSLGPHGTSAYFAAVSHLCDDDQVVEECFLNCVRGLQHQGARTASIIRPFSALMDRYTKKDNQEKLVAISAACGLAPANASTSSQDDIHPDILDVARSLDGAASAALVKRCLRGYQHFQRRDLQEYLENILPELFPRFMPSKIMMEIMLMYRQEPHEFETKLLALLEQFPNTTPSNQLVNLVLKTFANEGDLSKMEHYADHFANNYRFFRPTLSFHAQRASAYASVGDVEMVQSIIDEHAVQDRPSSYILTAACDGFAHAPSKPDQSAIIADMVWKLFNQVENVTPQLFVVALEAFARHNHAEYALAIYRTLEDNPMTFTETQAARIGQALDSLSLSSEANSFRQTHGGV